uniref:GAG-pre-integrase domain-containing protein n=1 Tax=Cajanus cajan TaxID=3821 RepID=A0A151RRN6_CAJCA|nr:hypothetical protein KK1_033260 [Cajanus cajan]
MMRGIKRHGLYSLEVETVTAFAITITTKTVLKVEIWHMRLGHVSEKGLIELGKQNLLCWDKVGKLRFCERCVYDKTCMVKFNTRQQRTKGFLDYVHGDLWGPSRTLSHSGARCDTLYPNINIQ